MKEGIFYVQVWNFLGFYLTSSGVAMISELGRYSVLVFPTSTETCIFKIHSVNIPS